jgi:hypothetical protein
VSSSSSVLVLAVAVAIYTQQEQPLQPLHLDLRAQLQYTARLCPKGDCIGNPGMETRAARGYFVRPDDGDIHPSVIGPVDSGDDLAATVFVRRWT